MAFDPVGATAQYIDSLGAPALAKAAAYTTGGHWLLLWNLVVTALVTWVFGAYRHFRRGAEGRFAG